MSKESDPGILYALSRQFGDVLWNKVGTIVLMRDDHTRDA
jgi:hypothetical protein